MMKLEESRQAAQMSREEAVERLHKAGFLHWGETL